MLTEWHLSRALYLWKHLWIVCLHMWWGFHDVYDNAREYLHWWVVSTAALPIVSVLISHHLLILQMLMNVRSTDHAQNTPPVQTLLALLYVPAMKDSQRTAVCALVRIHLFSLLMIEITVFCYFFTTDVDECQINGTCPEHSTCANTFGSFVCTCNEGFVKNGSVCIGKNFLISESICTSALCRQYCTMQSRIISYIIGSAVEYRVLFLFVLQHLIYMYYFMTWKELEFLYQFGEGLL